MAASTLAIGSSDYELLELLADGKASETPSEAAVVSQQGNRVSLQGLSGTINSTRIANTGYSALGEVENSDLGSDEGLNLSVFSNTLDTSIRTQDGDDSVRVYGNLTSSTNLARGGVSGSNNGIFAGTGNDNISIRGSVDDQVIKGELGSDTIRITGTVEDSYIFGGDGSDNITVRGNITNSYVNTGSGNDYADFRSSATNLIFQGDTGNDTVIFRKNVASNLGDGKSSVSSGSGDDVITFQNGAAGTEINTGTGSDTLFLKGEFFQDTFNLSKELGSELVSGSDYLFASSNSIFDSTTLNSYNTAGDTLVFGASSDFINSNFNLGSGNDLVNFGANTYFDSTSIDLGAGNDTIVFGASDISHLSGLSVSLGGGSDVIRFVGASARDLGSITDYIADASSDDTLYIGSTSYSYNEAGNAWYSLLG